jgi:hypothetical protein
VARPHPLLGAVFEAFDRRGVRWCVLRAADELDAPGGDVDLLVAAGDLRKVHEVVTAHGYLPLAARGQGSHRAFVIRSPRDGRWLKLDIVTRLDLGRRHQHPTGLAAAVLTRRRHVGELPVPDAADGFWLLVLHLLLDKDHVTTAHLRRLATAAEAAGERGPVAGFVAALLPASCDLAAVREAARDERWATIEPRLRAALRVAARRRRPLTSRRRAATNRLLGRAARAGLLPRPGLTVAVLAPDGAGKSTAIEQLTTAFPVPVRSLYLGLYPRDRRRTRIRGAGALGRLLRQWWGYFHGVRHRRAGRIVLFDRHGFDARLPSTRRDARRRVRDWVLGHACPAPDVTVVLDAPGTVLHRRKGELDPAELERRRQGYRALAARYAWHVVDASRDQEAVHRDLTDLIWHHYQQVAS